MTTEPTDTVNVDFWADRIAALIKLAEHNGMTVTITGGELAVSRQVSDVFVAQTEVQWRADPAAPAVPAGRDALRDRIAEALLTTHHREHGYHADCVVCAGDVNGLAAAVRAVLPPPADRAAVLREAADGFDRHAGQILDGVGDKAVFVAKALRDQAAVWSEAAETLRRLAAEAQQQTEPWTADGRLKTHLLPAATTPDQPSMTGGFDASIEIPDVAAVMPCGPAPDQCDAEAGEPCANHEREQAHAEGEHCFCGPDCQAETAACPDPIECGHEAALGQAQQEIRRLGLMVDEYGHGASALSRKLKGVRDAVAFAERVVATSGPGPASAVQAVIDRLRAALDPEQPAVVAAVAGEAEDPARIDRMRPEFTEHSSVEAIDAQLRRARAQERRWHIRTEWLISLRQARVKQKARGEWAPRSQFGKEA